jgi:hypothetical protein
VHPSPVRGKGAWAAYKLEGPGRVELRIVNVSGELVARLAEWKGAGRQRTRLPLEGAAPGVYILKVDVAYDAGGRRSMEPQKFAVVR